MKDKTLTELVTEYGENCAEIDFLDNNFRIKSGIFSGDLYTEKHKKSYKYCTEINEAILAEIKKRERKTCSLKEIDSDLNAWECSICGNTWMLCNDDTPLENNYKHCCDCGAEITEYVKYVDPRNEDQGDEDD